MHFAPKRNTQKTRNSLNKSAKSNAFYAEVQNKKGGCGKVDDGEFNRKSWCCSNLGFRLFFYWWFSAFCWCVVVLFCYWSLTSWFPLILNSWFFIFVDFGLSCCFFVQILMVAYFLGLVFNLWLVYGCFVLFVSFKSWFQLIIIARVCSYLFSYVRFWFLWIRTPFNNNPRFNNTSSRLFGRVQKPPR